MADGGLFMSTTIRRSPPRRRRSRPLLPLYNGDRMTQREFHRRYEAYLEDAKFELIGGVVYMASPLGFPHDKFHSLLSLSLGTYQADTPGVELADNPTTILADDSEPQPDLVMFIEPDFGGRMTFRGGKYLAGAPELIAEVAHSSVAIDLHAKKDDYQRAGVREYVVLCVDELELHWFNFAAKSIVQADGRGVFHSQVFPGLSIDAPALLARDSKKLIQTLQRGLRSTDHTRFVEQLRQRGRSKSKPNGTRR